MIILECETTALRLSAGTGTRLGIDYFEALPYDRFQKLATAKAEAEVSVLLGTDVRTPDQLLKIPDLLCQSMEFLLEEPSRAFVILRS